MRNVLNETIKKINGISYRIGDTVVYRDINNAWQKGILSQFGGTMAYLKVDGTPVLLQVRYDNLYPTAAKEANNEG